MIKVIRSLLFDACFYIMTPLVCLFFMPCLLLPFPYRFFGIKAWSWTILFCARYVLGLKFKVIGQENLPRTPFIIACKHQSAWETVALNTIIPQSTFILKHNLLYIPIVNLYMLALKCIAVKRGSGGDTINNMLEQARKVAAHNINIIIFPEGRRTAVGQKIRYRQGVSSLYTCLNVNVVPVALNSGLFWGRRSFLKRGGEITVQILPPIEPGLAAPLFHNTLQTCIEEATDKLCLETDSSYPPREKHD